MTWLDQTREMFREAVELARTSPRGTLYAALVLTAWALVTLTLLAWVGWAVYDWLT